MYYQNSIKINNFIKKANKNFKNNTVTVFFFKKNQASI